MKLKRGGEIIEGEFCRIKAKFREKGKKKDFLGNSLYAARMILCFLGDNRVQMGTKMGTNWDFWVHETHRMNLFGF